MTGKQLINHLQSLSDEEKELEVAFYDRAGWVNELWRSKGIKTVYESETVDENHPDGQEMILLESF